MHTQSLSVCKSRGIAVTRERSIEKLGICEHVFSSEPSVLVVPVRHVFGCDPILGWP